MFCYDDFKFASNLMFSNCYDTTLHIRHIFVINQLANDRTTFMVLSPCTKQNINHISKPLMAYKFNHMLILTYISSRMSIFY